jgi:hypothetical protein
MLCGLANGAEGHHAYVIANSSTDRVKVQVYGSAGLWLCTRRLAAGCISSMGESVGACRLTLEQFAGLGAGLPWPSHGRTATTSHVRSASGLAVPRNATPDGCGVRKAAEHPGQVCVFHRNAGSCCSHAHGIETRLI